jgi:hypothetical protein
VEVSRRVRNASLSRGECPAPDPQAYGQGADRGETTQMSANKSADGDTHMAQCCAPHLRRGRCCLRQAKRLHTATCGVNGARAAIGSTCSVPLQSSSSSPSAFPDETFCILAIAAAGSATVAVASATVCGTDDEPGLRKQRAIRFVAPCVALHCGGRCRTGRVHAGAPAAAGSAAARPRKLPLATPWDDFVAPEGSNAAVPPCNA